MPKQVDHEERRRRIAEAVCALIDAQGLEGVSLRDVATRAEVSMGAVQRCFRTKEEMLLFALGHVGERVTERARGRLVGSPAQSAASTVGHVVGELALLREEHRAEARIWLSFLAAAAVNPALAAGLRNSYADLEGLFTRLLAEASGAPDPEREARTLLALADGLTGHVLIGHRTTEEAEELLHAHLAGLWGPTGAAAGR
ncbi:TetR/AcrR family transcriptional regulator [Kitasatospora sp. SUK 42]|uniref:TetR/AcrR family transcriptional regulator n=1 Tax=Kitasatospora sp. SUK 42 TaxID=1588882 RepID=UPI0018C9DF3B|nr:TetR family transcriptional regulator C-terminal domain-containing protein [Kitasatospora sp. SUK 42]MBV2151539.1 TetR family transcriptional regulator C-terminal domain-containing protein [Kitasatospora sp. SUK 42]